MLPYFLVFLIPALMAAASVASLPFTTKWLWVTSFGILLFLFVGFRYEVGADWLRYREIFNIIENDGLLRSIFSTDIGFVVLNWTMSTLNIGFYGVTTMCAAVFVWGLISFAWQMPYPWISLIVAVPHLVNVMAMDHVRQSTAFGFVFVAMATLMRNGNVWMYIFWIIVAATFHKTAIILLPLALCATSRNKFLICVSVVFYIGIFWYFVLGDAADVYEVRYVGREYEAKAAMIRLAQNILPAILYIAIRHRLHLPRDMHRFWMVLSVAALMFPALIIISPSSAAVDRIGKYLIPLQLFVYSHLPRLFKKEVDIRILSVSLLCIYLFLYQALWFYQSDLASTFWIPYRSAFAN